MELAFLIGAVGGMVFLLVSFALGAGGNLLIYYDTMSVLTTIGGSLMALMVATPMDRMAKLGKIFSVAMKKNAVDPSSIIETLVTFAEKARREGVLSLEDDIAEIPDAFLHKAIQLVVDGTDPEIVKAIMYTEIDQMESRHANGKKIFDDWGYLLPSFGMIGTLQGLIAMLPTLQDKATLGPKMATALITTLYGAILANLYALPITYRLDLYNKYDVVMKEIVVEGVLSIQAGDNPAILREKLNSFLAPDLRPKQGEEGGER